MRDKKGDRLTVGGPGLVLPAVIWENSLTAVDGMPWVEWDNGSGQHGFETISAVECACADDKAILDGDGFCMAIVPDLDLTLKNHAFKAALAPRTIPSVIETPCGICEREAPHGCAP